MFPKIPDNLTSLTVAELRQLSADIKAAAETALAESSDRETLDTVKAALAARKDVIAPAIEAKELASALADEAVVEVNVEAPPEPVTPTEPPAEVTQDEDGNVAETPVEVPVAEATLSTRVTGTTGVTSTPQGSGIRPDLLVAQDNFGQGATAVRSGETFSDWGALAAAMLEKARDLRPNTGEKFRLASIPGHFAEDRILDDNKFFNLAKFDQEELTAALCAPFTPVYTMACQNTTRRPVKASLPTYRAPRMGVSIYPSPSLSDVAGSAGIWTAADDAIPSAEKGDCATITCATPVDYVMYGVYWCLTVKNMLAMSFPELLEAYLNRGAANHARIGEIGLLNAMATTAPEITVPKLGYGASTSLTTQVMHYLALYQEQQRWDAVEHEMWAPRWLQTALRIDQMRRRNTSGTPTMATEAAANKVFTDAGITPNWFIDTPSWSPTIPATSTAGALNPLPADPTVIIAPRGKYAVMDGGQLDIGVTGNNIYRDNASNKRNEFTYFIENFEGVVDTTSCPAARLTFDLCYNGVQAADVAVSCLGV